MIRKPDYQRVTTRWAADHRLVILLGLIVFIQWFLTGVAEVLTGFPMMFVWWSAAAVFAIATSAIETYKLKRQRWRNE
jgi:hypothetical protein